MQSECFAGSVPYVLRSCFRDASSIDANFSPRRRKERTTLTRAVQAQCNRSVNRTDAIDSCDGIAPRPGVIQEVTGVNVGFSIGFTREDRAALARAWIASDAKLATTCACFTLCFPDLSSWHNHCT